MEGVSFNKNLKIENEKLYLFKLFKKYGKILCMKKFKKRTLALVLASVVTVAGSFAAENYKNSLMSLNFESDSNGSINMILETKVNYTGNVSPIKRDAYTYVLMLPEVNSLAPTPDIKNSPGNIESVSIKTLPYTTGGKGYTRITVKTMSPITLGGKAKIYIPSETTHQAAIEEKQKPLESNTINKKPQTNIDEFTPLKKQYNKTVSESVKEVKVPETIIVDNTNKNAVSENSVETLQSQDYDTSSSNETIMLILGLLFIFAVTLFFYTKAKNKLAELAGEKLEIDVNEEDNNQKNDKKSKLKKIKDTVKTLDKAYAKSAAQNVYTKYQKSVKKLEQTEKMSVIDLDEIFQEQIKNQTNLQEEEEEENIALEEFLNGFSFYEEEIPEEPNSFDEDFYNKLISREDIKFSPDDIDCINQLLLLEINNDTLQDIEKYAISKPIKKSEKEIKEKKFEEIVTDFAINQNIIFTGDDILALRKLMSVELDNDFITDLRINPIRTKQMEEEMFFDKDEIKKPSKIITLNVKDMLPNISEELEKQIGKKIESNYRPEPVYYQAGYDVEVLKIEDDLPDLSKRIQDATNFEPQESAKIEFLDNTYQVDTLKVSQSLTNFKNIITSDENIEKQKNKTQNPDEKKLLKNIENVKLKPISEKTLSNNIKEQLQKKITDKILEKKLSEPAKEKNLLKNTTDKKLNKKNEPSTKNIIEKCVVEEESYSIVSTIEFEKNIGCYLGRNDNCYILLGYEGNKIKRLKTYEKLDSEKMLARKSENLDNNTQRYIVKIGKNKVVIDVNCGQINYVMDLC